MYCRTCANKICLKTKKPCKEVERYLEKNPEGYSERHIRRKEIPYNPALLDEFLPLKALERLRGKRKLPTKPRP